MNLHLHCVVFFGGKSLATSVQALFNAINILLGVGVLTVPYAIAEGGWAAVLLLALLGVITNYTGEIPRRKLTVATRCVWLCRIL